jgi:hypothetical protein
MQGSGGIGAFSIGIPEILVTGRVPVMITQDLLRLTRRQASNAGRD